MKPFAILFSAFILSLFWGGFLFTLFYLLKLKSKKGDE